MLSSGSSVEHFYWHAAKVCKGHQISILNDVDQCNNYKELLTVFEILCTKLHRLDNVDVKFIELCISN